MKFPIPRQTHWIGLAALILCVWYGCAPMRATRWREPDLNDSSKFKYARLQANQTPFRFVPAVGQPRYAKMKKYLDSALQQTNTHAFLVIKNDSIIYENFAQNVNYGTLHPSFSVAKSYIGTLIGMAIDKGIIASTNDLVIKYMPELEKNDRRFRKLTIQHVLDMQSGFDFDEDSTSPFGSIAKLYYGNSLKNQVAQLKMKKEPGQSFEYQSINTQLLAALLERASGEKIESLMAKYLWQPLGAESDAIWSLDGRKTVKAFCCLNATATDFAKLGRLYLKKGNWEGTQIVSNRWINGTVNPDSLGKRGYKNQWWACSNISYFKDSLSASQKLAKLNLKVPIKKMKNGTYYFQTKSNDYRAEGILGQIVYVNPDNNVIIVRLGNYPNKNLYFNGFIPAVGREIN